MRDRIVKKGGAAIAAKQTAPPRTSRKARTRSLYPLGGRYSEKRAYHENHMYLQPQAGFLSPAASGLQGGLGNYPRRSIFSNQA